jgi:ketosteroid isomerase-like protein
MATSRMSPEEVVRAFLDAYNVKDLDGAMACLAADFVGLAASTKWVPLSKASYRDKLTRTAFAFPDCRWETTNMVVSGDTVAVRVIWTGTFLKPLVWQGRTRQPTGRGYRAQTCVFFRVNENGLIQDHNHYENWDFLKEYSSTRKAVAA